jgi:hypothetical protein
VNLRPRDPLPEKRARERKNKKKQTQLWQPDVYPGCHSFFDEPNLGDVH